MTISVNRRTVLTGTVALGTVGLLAACGSKSKESAAGGTAATSSEEILKNLNINEKSYDQLKKRLFI